MNDEFSAAWRFEMTIQDRCAERLEPFRWGTGLLRPDLPRVYDQNMLRLERGFAEVTAAPLAAHADRIQRAAGLAHRKVLVPDETAGERLAPDFAELGWRRTRHLLMAYRGGEPGPARHRVSVLEQPALRAARTQVAMPDLGGHAAAEVTASLELIASVVSARAFAVSVDGGPVSWCVLYEEGGIGQVDDVVTAPEQRRRGFGRAVVEAALRASLEAGNELTFLVADDEDWPKEMYARLGFEPIGRRYEFTRP